MSIRETETINGKPRSRAAQPRGGGRKTAAERVTRAGRHTKSHRTSRATKAEPTFSFASWTANTDWAELLKDLAGLVLLVFGVVLLFSLVSYDKADPSVNTVGSNLQVKNWIGPVGASMASQFYKAFGWLAWGFPLLILGGGWWLLRPRQLPMPGVKLFGWLLVLVALVGLLALSDLGSPQNGDFHRSGWIGQLLVRDGLVGSLNQIGSFILLAALLLAGILISTPFSLSWLPKLVDDLSPGGGEGARWSDSLMGTFRRRYDLDEEDDADALPQRRRAVRPLLKDSSAARALAGGKDRAQPVIVGSEKRKPEPPAPVIAPTEPEKDEWFAFEDDEKTGANAVVVNRETRPLAQADAPKRGRVSGRETEPEIEPVNGHGTKRIPTSLRGDQRPLPLKKRPASERAPWDDDTDEEFDEANVHDGAPPPPQPPPRRTVDEMLSSATVKRIETAELEKAPESKLKQVVKSVARLMANFKLPDSDMLSPAAARPEVADAELMERARQLAEKCAEFNVSGKVTRISPGPVVTTFEFKPDPGVKYSRITGLVDDLCLGLKAESVRIDRIPGKSTVGIEVPNTTRETIRLREVIESKEFRDSTSKLTLALGKTIYGSNYVADLKKMPHLLIAGATGAGKSVALNSILVSMLYKASPDEVKCILVDPKRLELGLYADLPHLLTPIVTDPKRASYSLKWAVSEMENRYKHLAAFGVRNIDQYNTDVCAGYDPKRDADNDDKPKPLPYIVIIIDELADLMMVSARDVEESITRLAQMARAVGIHLILATQRPSVDVITGLIKANFPSRISFRVSSKVDSRTIIDTNGAEGLLGQGDMLFLPPGTSRLVRVHGAYVDEKEVKRVCDFIRSQGQPTYDERVTLSEKEMEGSEASSDARRDEKYYDAVKIVIEMGRASTSVLQRRLRIGYGRAASIIDMMEHEGIIGPEEGASKPRQVLVKADFLERIGQLREEEY
ncbi:MAG: DNA translocase FtsK [Acidobacteria bacterium]|nr:DNA translocase FtsK [Acidobacteriota bacterium]MBI3423321.1 DNA translocase FtsK [Acidobacteriota bacterium]